MGGRRWVWLLGAASAVFAAPADEAVVRLFQPVHCTPSAVLRKLGLAPDGTRPVGLPPLLADELAGVDKLEADDKRGILTATGSSDALERFGARTLRVLDREPVPLVCRVYHFRAAVDLLRDPDTHLCLMFTGWAVSVIDSLRPEPATYLCHHTAPPDNMLRTVADATGKPPMPVAVRRLTNGEPLTIPVTCLAVEGQAQVARTTRVVLWPRLTGAGQSSLTVQMSVDTLPTRVWQRDGLAAEGAAAPTQSLRFMYRVPSRGESIMVFLHAPKVLMAALDGWPLFVADDTVRELLVIDFQLATPPPATAPQDPVRWESPAGRARPTAASEWLPRAAPPAARL